MKYPIKITKKNADLLIDIIDIHNANTLIHNESELQKKALETFELSLNFYSNNNLKVPLPTQIKMDAELYIPVNLSAKIHLFNTFLSSNLSKKEIILNIILKLKLLKML